MKKFIQKNCIAFTIMEMTLVLLITSIIAAATTPILTSAVSDYADQNYKATAGESSNAPWRPTSSYDGGGIYNSKLENTSPIGIGVKFGASPSNYGYPTLAVKTFTDGNLVNAPQIKITLTNANENITMDEFENVALVHDYDADNGGIMESFSAMVGNNNYMGEKSVYLGTGIQYKSPDSEEWYWHLDESTGYYRADKITIEGRDPANMYYNQSIFLGTYIDTRMNEDSIYIGSFMNRDINERDVIVIGHDMNTESYAATYEGNILIGNYANVGRVADSIAIGNYSGYSSVFKHDIAIGNYANYNGSFYTSFVWNLGPSSNVAIGQYAGAIFGQRGTLEHGNFSAVNIGGYAGFIYEYDKENSSVLGHNAGTVNIGDFAGYKEVVNDENGDIRGGTPTTTINIGYYAGSSYEEPADQAGDGREYSVAIGYYAGRNSFAKNSVIIGSATGTYSNTESSVLIGSGIKEFSYDCRNDYETPECIYPTGTWTAGTAGTDPAYGIVAIGTNAGTNSDYKGIYLGAYAGHWGSGHLYGNVGIGPWTCSYVEGSNKWCLGWGSPGSVSNLNVVKNHMSLIGNTTVWNTNVLSKTPQMFIGDARGAIQADGNQRVNHDSSDWNHTAITLYAGHIYRYGSGINSNLTLDQLRWSDKRLKTNISKVYGSLDKIRSVNIYDYTLKNDEHHTPKIGVIAQEFKKIFPYEVKVEPNSKNYAVGTGSLLYTMLDAIKDLDINIQHLQTSFDNYVKDFFGLKSKVAKLEAQSKKLQADNAQMKSRLAKINAKLK